MQPGIYLQRALHEREGEGAFATAFHSARRGEARGGRYFAIHAIS